MPRGVYASNIIILCNNKRLRENRVLYTNAFSGGTSKCFRIKDFQTSLLRTRHIFRNQIHRKLFFPRTIFILLSRTQHRRESGSPRIHW